MYKKPKYKEEVTLYEIEKRILDIIISLIAIIVFSPIFIVIAILVKISSQGPVWAPMPKRVGKNGKLFFMYKFRSMFENAHQMLRQDPQYKELYEKYKANSFKLSVDEDPRITQVGKFIRKTSLDELPQFLNVLKGEMSIVGPRAYFAEELREQAEHYPKTRKLIRKVMTIKPGITGPWQVGGRSEINFTQRIRMDAVYAKTRSMRYDIKLMLKTPIAVLLRKGAV